MCLAFKLCCHRCSELWKIALAVIAAFDALLCSRLVNQPDDKPIDR